MLLCKPVVLRSNYKTPMIDLPILRQTFSITVPCLRDSSCALQQEDAACKRDPQYASSDSIIRKWMDIISTLTAVFWLLPGDCELVAISMPWLTVPHPPLLGTLQRPNAWPNILVTYRRRSSQTAGR